MEVIKLFKCLGDEQRLRILNLLEAGPLCVCHLVEILGADQVKVSKQLRYMKDMSVLENEREAQWMIYRLAAAMKPLLSSNLTCLRNEVSSGLPFSEDLEKRAAIIERLRCEPIGCASALLADQKPCCTTL